MTQELLKIRKSTNNKNISTILCFSLSIALIIFGEDIRLGIYNGFLFSIKTIIPTLFPFFILADLWISVYSINSEGQISRIFSRLFGVNGDGLCALISGIICGFPIGVKIASDLYNDGRITKDELQTLCGFSSNPSIAFVISGVGIGILNDLELGLLLCFSTVMSSLMVGVVFKNKGEVSKKTGDIQRQRFNIVNSIRSAGINSINVISCIVFFSGILELINKVVDNDIISAIVSPLFELSNAIQIISRTASLNQTQMLTLIAFSLGFSGLSVHLQSFAFLPKEFSRRKYLITKLFQGLFSCIITRILLFFK